ncbi:helix-turn-helix domain-containing protein [Iamia sp. SCSIO 61187]|uniref:helix-turn-helix domain-containing protein n=1 Tax=Iamia sp. SCSIO 61187 TaxID=2722752 RepID=UPI001C6334A8|nr:helix-turn-helix domain-containing protein [Iamia sp. SCSIO 61187]
MPTTGHWLRTDELALFLGISERMVRKLLAQGMPSLTIGRARRFDPDRCLAWLESRSEAA